jgi:predicted phosphodiesterase
MICILGDIHGNVRALSTAIEPAERLGAAALIQVGDFGLTQRNG